MAQQTYKLSVEHRRKLSEALQGKPKTPEHIEKVRQALLGKKLSPAHRRKLSEAHKGLDNHQTDRHHTDEFKRFISDFHKGNAYAKGYKHTPETRKKLSEALRGKAAWNKGLKGYNAGEKSPFWKGGKTTADRKERIRFRREIQKLIFERDNYTCQLCGNIGDLSVDHIQPWADYVELRFSMDNCRTLCKECHYQITFGKLMPAGVKTWGHNLGRRVAP